MAALVIIGIGSNLPDRAGRSPREKCERAVQRLELEAGLRVRSVSYYYRTAPVPASDQPDYINAVALCDGTLTPDATLVALHRIEAEAGRLRGTLNGPRTLDLDLLAWDDLVLAGPGLVLPHPRMHERAFVLYPFCDVAPGWRHPVLELTASALRDALAPQSIARDLP